MNKKIIGKILLIAFVFLGINTNSLFALLPYLQPTTSTTAKCEGNDVKTWPCGECPDGTKPYGNGAITCTTHQVYIDYGLETGMTSAAISAQQRTHVFFSDDAENVTKGKGYIGAIVTYNHLHNRDSILVNSYILCDAVEIQDYNEWLVACAAQQYSDIHTVQIIPNPVVENQAIIRVDGIESSCSFSFYLYYGSELVHSYSTSSFVGEMIINNSIIARSGAYHLVYTLNGFNGTANFIVQ